MSRVVSWAFILVSAFLAGCVCAPSAVGQSVFLDQGAMHPKPPRVPDEVVFAGETIRFDRSDLRERMDRELISFTYMHSNSLLILRRADRFFRQVVPILREQGLPEDLKYLMVIESNLDPRAVSSAGAAGLWQFTRDTAREYGLECSAEVDERYNIEKETRAACAYLKKAHDRFGDWLSVAASYNSGQNGIAKRREDQRQRSALDLWMPEETSRYIFRMLAAKLFLLNPESFGFHVDPDEIYPYIPPRRTVTVGAAIPNLTDFAEEHGVTYARLKEANLWLRDNKLTNKAGKTYRIIIPGDNPR